MLFEYQLSLCLTMSVHCLLLPGCYQLIEKATVIEGVTPMTYPCWSGIAEHNVRRA